MTTGGVLSQQYKANIIDGYTNWSRWWDG
jgi:hypothetical protein